LPHQQTIRNIMTIFDEQIARKPTRYPWAQEYIDAMWSGHWTPNEFTFTSDLQQYKTEMTPEEQVIIKNALSAIGQIEISVKKFWTKLGDNLPHPALSDLGITMGNIEVIHNNAYEKLLDVLQLQDVFEENLKLDIIQGRVKYLRKYLDKHYKDSRKQYIYSLILFTLYVENVSLFSQFYIINWFNRYKGLLKDTAQQVAYTAKEETLHALAGVKIVNTIREELPELFDDELEARILHEAAESYKAECKIIDWMIGDYSDEKISAEILKEYVKNRLNSSLEMIGFKKIFEVDNDIIELTMWMDEDVMGSTMTDFFHKRPVEYAKKTQSITSDDIF
jgi:ribonucleoside-diphosphate reductase beta chain